MAKHEDGAIGPDRELTPVVPSISLPKGGGAIRSIGEKFAANPVTGTGLMSVPIAASPGRSNFGPRLSLSYDSGAGNGPFGFGWNLSLPAIARKTDKGLPQYNDAEESDVFILSGAEDMVPAFRQNPDGTWARDPSGRLVVHEEELGGYRVRRYRPRIEGLFARIERWSRIGTFGDVHWRSFSRDNVLTLYGLSPESRLFDPMDATRVFAWLICETRDDRGNAVLYRYKAEDGLGVRLDRAHERNRGVRNDVRRTANRYLKRVHYGNRTPLLDEAGRRPRFLDRAQIDAQIRNADWMFEVVFDYGDHDAAAPAPDDDQATDAAGAPRFPWKARPDAFSAYRPGFEVRTARLCQRVLMFHHFPAEAGVGRNCLVRSTDFTYSDDVDPQDVRNPVYAFLRRVTQAGYRRNSGGYDARSLPPMEFVYSEPVVQDKVEPIEAPSLENLPMGLDGIAYRWTDLHGEGIPGILTEQGGAWYYKRNLSPIPERQVDGREQVRAKFAALETVASKPSVALNDGAELLDLAGDGQPDVVVMDGPAPGLFEHDEAEGWGPFRPFASRLNRDPRDPNLRLVDLDGDGQADALITEDDAFVWHPSLAEKGFGPARRVVQALDEEKSPRIVFVDGTQSIYLADLSGDGLADIVRIRNGEVCYWPNLGYGRFGAKVTMDNGPLFDHPERFDHERLRLADIDGSGTTDILYLHPDGVRLYFNQSGNGWSRPQVLKAFPRVDELVSIVPADLLGNGTACLVWSSLMAGDARSPMRYVNLMGGRKPHLLVRIINNLGAETSVDYAPSTKFYLQDRLAGRPWITRLPFPVHVVERVETFDHVSRNRLVTCFSYHHGYFDGEEREFRGFGMVEQRDTEAFEDYVVGVRRAGGAQELAPELNQPPVTTRTWYHTGAFVDHDRILHQYRQEYYRQEQHTPEPDFPADMSPQELRECLRALKGLPLRQEIYSLDGSPDAPHPYAVTENHCEVRWLQPRGTQRHGVFFPIGRESVSLNYERNPEDPRISHTLGLDLDEYGNPRKSCSVVYGRRISDPSLPAEITRDQQRRYVTYVETDYTTDIEQGAPPGAYRLRVPFESRSHEITGITPAAALFRLEEIQSRIAGTAAIGYEILADGVTPQRRFLSHSRTLFLDNSLNPLPLGQWDSLGLVHQSYRLAFTQGVLSTHYAGKVSDSDLAAAGYVHFGGDADWWIPSGTAIYPVDPRAHFHLPIGTKGPLGVETVATRDSYDLMVEKVEVKQAPWSVVSAVNDYRVLGPELMIDPNKNRSAVGYDELGMVDRTAVMGKAGSPEGDTLADPTTRMDYNLHNWMNNHKPNYVHTLAREKHGQANPRWQESYTYSNGSGGVAMVKSQAHPGKAFIVKPNGTRDTVDADPRWVGNGRTILNNKGRPVKQYEPYFSTTHEYEDEKVLREIGVTPILYYDPIGRNVRTLFPNGTLSRGEFNPWVQKVFDANDTVKRSRWYVARGSPDPAAQPEPLNDPERRAAWLAAKHADTAGMVHFDSLGRPVYAISDYGGGKTSAVRTESDLSGRTSRLFDQERREVAAGFVDMAGTPIAEYSAERGRRWSFPNVLGALVKAWDEHGRQFRLVYDAVHRPIGAYVQEAGEAEVLLHYVVYGDRVVNAEQLNLLGAAHQMFDQAGMLRVREIDFKGNPKTVDRVLAKDYKNALDWTSLPGQPNYDAIQAAAGPALDSVEVFTAGSQYDALNRPTQVTLPDGTLIEPTYNEANLLATLRAKIRGQGNFVEFLKKQDYDAKGQRQFAHYGNQVITRYLYDPDTFRLINLLTHQAGANPHTEGLQNLHYTYDPVGNITQIIDEAQQTHYFNNSVVKPESRYEYDAIYQLIHATGRELAGLGNDAIRTHADLGFIAQLPHVNDSDAVRTYTEEYEYDLLGNVRALKHRFKPQPGAGAGWTRYYRYAFDDVPGDCTNRLTATSMPGDPDVGPFSGTYGYDVYGNMKRMPHLAAMDWTVMDQLGRVDMGGGGTAHYVYGLGGQRLRKVVERNGTLALEWIFLGAVVIHRRRRRDTNALRLERWTVHISDNIGRIAQVDVKTRDDDNIDPANPLNAVRIRFQYSNHLGSGVLETDENGNPISYEEFHPYGTTAYRSAKPGFDLSLKRYRFSDRENDEETGLYYFGARYYAPWLARWTSTDPAGFTDGANVFRYSRNNPVNYIDSLGLTPRLVSFDAEPEEISYSGTPEAVIEHYNRNPVIGTGTIMDDETEESVTVPMSVRLVVRGVTRATQTGGVNAGREFWRISDYDFVPGSGRLLTDLPVAEEGNGSNPSGRSSESGTAAPDDLPTESQGGSASPTESSTDAPSSGAAGNGPPVSDEPRESSALDRLPHPNAGAAAVTTWDSVQRGRYTSGNASRSADAVSRVRAAAQTEDAVQAWEAARRASEARNAARLATQGRLSPGGRAMSQAIDAGRTFESSAAEYATRAPGARTPSPTRYAYTIAERVAEGAGRSHPWMSRLARGGRVLGPLGIAVGAGFAARNIYNAPPEERGRVTAGEVGTLAGGMVGVSLGMSAGVALAGGVSGLLIGLGLVAGPIGWLAIGIGIVGAIAGAWAFGNLGRGIGEALYDW